jgi:murein DD-endopeptidase MepM/ murein hydrolase activator NlpD
MIRVPGPIGKPVSDFLSFANEYLSLYRDTPDWSWPLADRPVANRTLFGSFGEWRGQIRHGAVDANYHAGLDISANAGDVVYASRGGRLVTANGNASGRYVTIDHLDSTYSRYLHLGPATTNDPITTNQPILRGTRIGVVGTKNFTGVSPHHHFEIRDAASGSTNGEPGIGRDPIRDPNLFALKPATSLCDLRLVGVSMQGPARTVYLPFSPPSLDHSSLSAYVVAQVVHPEAGYRLAPKSVKLVSFDTEEINTATETEIKGYLPGKSPEAAGFAKYWFGESTHTFPSQYYHYWFLWTLNSAMAGPQSFDLTAVNYSDAAKTWHPKWGPEILSVTQLLDPNPGEGLFEVNVRSWVGEEASSDGSPAATWVTPNDWYEWDLPPQGTWMTNSASVYKEEPFALIGPPPPNQRLRSQRFVWKPQALGQSTITITVRSRTAPMIAHQVTTNVCIGGIRADQPSYEAFDAVHLTQVVCGADGTPTFINAGELVPTLQGTNDQYGFEVRSSGILVSILADGSRDLQVQVSLNGSTLGIATPKGNAWGSDTHLAPATGFRGVYVKGQNTLEFKNVSPYPEAVEVHYDYGDFDSQLNQACGNCLDVIPQLFYGDAYKVEVTFSWPFSM